MTDEFILQRRWLTLLQFVTHPLGRLRCKWVSGIKIDARETDWSWEFCGNGETSSTQGSAKYYYTLWYNKEFYSFESCVLNHRFRSAYLCKELQLECGVDVMHVHQRIQKHKNFVMFHVSVLPLNFWFHSLSFISSKNSVFFSWWIYPGSRRHFKTSLVRSISKKMSVFSNTATNFGPYCATVGKNRQTRMS